MIKIRETEGFRTSCKEYFDYVSSMSDNRQQISPFILYKNNKVKAIAYTRDLLAEAKPNDIILQAWPGKWKTDVFTFKMSEFLEYRKSLNE